MNDAAQLNLFNFSLVYLLLLAVLGVMKKCRLSQSRLLIVASIRMTVQLILAGLILTYIFESRHPAFTLAYLAAMNLFAIHRILSKNPWLNVRFKTIIVMSFVTVTLAVAAFFVGLVVRVDLLNPQYAIPLSGMIIGNAMTGVTLALKTFKDNLSAWRPQIEALHNFGAEPRRILEPLTAGALETALLPTLNSMLSMGIIALPGMMTGQILSGTLPSTAILYQIAIMVAVCTVVCLAVFCVLYFGAATLYNRRLQFTFPSI